MRFEASHSILGPRSRKISGNRYSIAHCSGIYKTMRPTNHSCYRSHKEKAVARQLVEPLQSSSQTQVNVCTGAKGLALTCPPMGLLYMPPRVQIDAGSPRRQLDVMIPLTKGIEQQVFKLVPTQSLNALSATNRQFRQLVRMYTSQLKVRRRQDMLQSANHSWPRLATLDVSCASLDATSISAFLVGQMPLLQHLNLSHNKLRPAAIQQLVQGNWPSLSTLNLASTFGGNHVPEHDIVASCQYLATANWLQLTEIDVSVNSLPSTAVAELAKARWPALQSISISGGTHGPFIKHLAEASWTALRALELHCARVGTGNAQSLQQPCWSQLTRLNLRCSLNFNPEEGDLAMSIQLIAAGHWPQLAVSNVTTAVQTACYHSLISQGYHKAARCHQYTTELSCT